MEEVADLERIYLHVYFIDRTMFMNEKIKLYKEESKTNPYNLFLSSSNNNNQIPIIKELNMTTTNLLLANAN